MDEVIPVGTVPDEVLLLLCGQPGSVPSAWWTPSLVDDEQDTVDQLVAAAAGMLEAHGVRDPDTGELTGPLGAVAAIIAEARLLLLLETERPDGRRERRAVIAAEHDAVLDRQTPEGHDLLLAGAKATAALLVELLMPSVATTGRAAAALVGRRTPDEVAAALPAHERITTVRITRSTAGDDPEAHMLTVVHHADGAVACWAVPAGAVEVQSLDADAAVDLSLALLGAEVGEVAA